MRNNGLRAKISAMTGKLLSREGYGMLCRAPSAEAFGLLLKELSDYKALVGDENAPRMDAEAIFRQALDDDFARIARFVTNFPTRRFLHCYFAKFDRHAEPPGFQAALQRELRQAARLRHAERLYLNKADQAALGRISGEAADMRNIIWLYRLKRQAHIPPALLYSTLIPDRRRLTEAQLVRMVQAGDADTLKMDVSQSAYAHVFENFDAPERAAAIRLTTLHRQAAQQSAVGAAVCHLFMKAQEIKNMTSILEGIGYGIPPKTLMGTLVL